MPCSAIQSPPAPKISNILATRKGLQILHMTPNAVVGHTEARRDLALGPTIFELTQHPYARHGQSLK